MQTILWGDSRLSVGCNLLCENHVIKITYMKSQAGHSPSDLIVNSKPTQGISESLLRSIFVVIAVEGPDRHCT